MNKKLDSTMTVINDYCKRKIAIINQNGNHVNNRLVCLELKRKSAIINQNGNHVNNRLGCLELLSF